MSYRLIGLAAFAVSSCSGGGVSRTLPANDGGQSSGGQSNDSNGSSEARTPGEEPILDSTFGVDGVVALDGIAVAMVATKQSIVWTNASGPEDTGQILLHELSNEGVSAGPAIALPHAEGVAGETPTALYANPRGLRDSLVIGIKARGSGFNGSFIEEVSDGTLTTWGAASDSLIADVTDTIPVGAVATTLAGDAVFAPSRMFARSARAVSVVQGDNIAASMVGAAIAADGTVILHHGPSAFALPDSFKPAGGAENVDLVGYAGEIFATGFTREGRLFFQLITSSGGVILSPMLLDAQARAVHFTAAVTDGSALYLAGCIDSPRRPWIGAYALNKYAEIEPKLQFQGSNEALLPSIGANECVKTIVVDRDLKLLALVSPELGGGTGNDRIVRVKTR